MNEIYTKKLFDIICDTSNLLINTDVKYIAQLSDYGERVWFEIELLDCKIKIKKEEKYYPGTPAHFYFSINGRSISETLGRELERLLMQRKKELTRIAEVKQDEETLRNILGTKND